MYRRSGVADSRLHGGFAPPWLLKRMKLLAREIFRILFDEYGSQECIRRLADCCPKLTQLGHPPGGVRFLIHRGLLHC